MKHLSELFLQLYFNEADRHTRLLHASKLLYEPQYAEQWSAFCGDMQQDKIKDQKLRPELVEQVLETLDYSKSHA